MKDENGKPIGVLSHIMKTHVTESRSGDTISTLCKDLDDIKIDDQLSNEEILSYINPREQTNKQNMLSDAIDVSNAKEKFKTSVATEKKEGQFNISAKSNTSNTGLMD